MANVRALAVAAALAAATTLSLSTGSAQAAAPSSSAQPAGVLDSIVCAGTETNTFSPPLTNTTRTTSVQLSDNYSCTQLSNSLLSSATATRTAVLAQNCVLTAAPATDPYSITYQFNTGQATVTYTSATVINEVDGSREVISVGAVTSGIDVGAPVTRTVIIPSLSLTACGGSGITTYSGVTTLTITPVGL
jgi:hypothetical protein